MSEFKKIKNLLDERIELYNKKSFIEKDPICIPHRFQKKQDIEIAGFFAAIFAWGNRTTIIHKSDLFLNLMGMAPADFVLNFEESDLKPFLAFKHRTFNASDAIFYLHFFKDFYSAHPSLEHFFASASQKPIEEGLNNFYGAVCSHPYFQKRNAKHISAPFKKSRCKRLNMFLRWMVRKDNQGVDFGIWKSVRPADLLCPLDVHVEKVARKLGLIKRKASDWQSVLELTENLKLFDPNDPVKYDFALFGLSTEERLI